jgi:Large polyvalent protein associated domain 38
MMDLSKLSDGDVLALLNGDMNSLSDDGLLLLAGLERKAPTGGLAESAIGAGKRGLASAKTAITAPFIGGEEAGVQGIEAQKAIEERPGFSWDEIKRKYEQEGVLPAIGEAASQVPGTIAEQAPTLGAILAGGRLGAMGGGALAGPMGAVAGGIGGAALYPFLTQSGSNIERQVQEQQAKGEPVDVNLLNAYGAGAGQTALEMALGPEALLARGAGKKLSEEALKKLAAETTLKSVAKGVGKTAVEEIPTEIAQQALERAQAGLPISPEDQQALDEYLASGVGAALAGPIGGPMRLMERGSARDQIAQQEAAAAEEEQKRLAQEAEQRRIEDIVSQSGGQTTLPGFEPIVPSEPTEEPIEKTPEEKAIDHLLGLNKSFTNPSQVKDALKDTEFSELKPKKLLDLYKQAPQQTALFEDNGELNAEIVKAADQRKAVQDKATADMKAKLDKLKEGQNLDLFGAGSAPRISAEEAVQEAPSQGGSANLTMQQAMKEAEQQTAIDQANRQRETLYGSPEFAPMNLESADRRAQAFAEGAPYEQRALEMQQALQQKALEEQQQKASEAMAKKLAQAKPGQTLDLFGKAREAIAPVEEAVQEAPSQGGSANLQIQQAIREAEQANNIDKANELRQQLYATPEGELLTPIQQQQRVEAEPFKKIAEQKADKINGDKTKPIEQVQPEQQSAKVESPYHSMTLEEYQANHPNPYRAPKGILTTDISKMSDKDVLSQFKKDDLKDMAALLGAKISGAPQQILGNIRTALENRNMMKDMSREKLSEMKLYELQDLAKKLGTSKFGSKSALINNLSEWRKNNIRSTQNKMAGRNLSQDIFKAVRDGDVVDVKANVIEPETLFTHALTEKTNPNTYNNIVNRYAGNIAHGLGGVRKASIKRIQEEISSAKTPFEKQKWEDLAAAINQKTAKKEEVWKSQSQKLEAIKSKKPSVSTESTTNTHTNDTLSQALAKRYGNNVPKVNMGSRADVDGDTTVQGFYDPATKSVTLIPENIDLSKDLHGLIRHEVAVHAKQLGKTDAEFKAILKQLQSLKDKGTKAVQDAYAKVPKDTAEADIHEEALGYLVEHAKALPIVRRFMSWLRRAVHNLTGNANWLRADDFAKMADEVLSAKTKPSTVAREKTAPLYSKVNDPDLKAATQVYGVPQRAAKPNLNQRFTSAKAAVTKDSIGQGLLNMRTAIAHSGAPIQKYYQDAYNGAIRDAISGKISGHVLLDQALDSAHTAAATINQGIPVFENGIPKVKQSTNTVENAMKILKSFGDRIGSQEDADHATQAYMLAQNYDRILRNNEKLQKQIDALKATGKAIDKARAKKLQDRIAHINPAQTAAIKPGLEYGNRHPEIKKIADMWEAIKNADIDFQEQAGVLSKELADKYRNDPGYVPMYRVMDDMEKANPGAKSFYKGVADVKAEKHFEGSDKDVKNIFENMLARHMWAVESAIRNNANRRLSEDLGIVDDNGNTKYYSTQPTGKSDTTAPVWIDGKRKWVEYSDPTFATAIKGVEPIVNPMMASLGKASRLLRMSVTSMPTFQIVQILKDAPRAALLSGVDHPFELMGRVLKDATSLYQDMLTGKENAVIKEMERVGISSGYGHTAEEINDRMRRQLGLEANTKVKQALDMIEKIAAISDAAQRKAVYEQTLKETGDKDLAEDRARNIINWKRHGANHNVRILSQIVPFMNAYIQSMDVLLSAMMGTGISGKDKAVARMRFAQVLGQMMVLSAIYAMVVADDEDYQKMDDKKKLNSLVIPGTGVHIPVASEIGLLVKALPELTYQYVTREGTNNPLDAAKIKSTIGNAIGDALFSPNLTPQALKPIVEIATNHSFLTGTPIIGHGLERKATSEQFVESTSELAKLLGKTNLIAPVNADHFIKGYGGTMASLGLTLMDSIVNQFSDVKRPETAWYKNPVISPFINDPRYKDEINSYYDLLKESDKVALKLKDLKKAGKTQEAREFREENKEMVRTRQQLQNLSNRMEKLREQHKRIVASNLSAEDKRQRLDELEDKTGKVLRNINALRVKSGM